MADHNFDDLQSYVNFLDRIGDLKRIKGEVDPILEITEISCKTIEKNGPALLFENVLGSRYPVVTNIFGSEERLKLALGCDPKELGQEILFFMEKMIPPKIDNIIAENNGIIAIFLNRIYNITTDIMLKITIAIVAGIRGFS